MHFRLSLLMFLNFTILGAWVPVLSPFLNQLECTPRQAAWIFAANALAAILAPVFWGQIADRWLAAERCILICCWSAGAILWLVAASTEPILIFWGCLFFWMFMIPAVSLGATMSFRHLRNPDKEYGRVRLWGTIGWIAVGWLLTGWFRFRYGGDGAAPAYADALRLGAACCWITGVYAWTLPHTPPVSVPGGGPQAAGWLTRAFGAPLSALQLFRHRSFAVLCACLLIVYLTFALSLQLTALLVRQHLGSREEWLPLLQTLAQSTEVATLALLPVFLVRLGQKGTMLLGLAAWTVALTVFSIGAPSWLVIASLGLHGIFVGCFVVAGQLFINRLARDDMRASAQGLIQLINGLGLLTGHFVVGWLRTDVGEDYSRAFVLGAIVAGMLVVAFGAGFQVSRR